MDREALASHLSAPTVVHGFLIGMPRIGSPAQSFALTLLNLPTCAPLKLSPSTCERLVG